MIQKLSIFALAMTFVLSAFGQSRTVENFEKNADGYKLFLYQSVIRMMNKDKNPDFNMLIRDLDHLRFVSTDSEGLEEAKITYKNLDKGVQAEGFGEIMSFDNAQYKCRVYEKESSGGKSTWVATLLMDDVAGVLEMEGSLNLKYINALSSLDMDKVSEYLPVEKQKEVKKTDRGEKGGEEIQRIEAKARIIPNT